MSDVREGLDELILRVLDGVAAPGLEAELRARLLSDPEACGRFVALSCQQQAIGDVLRQRAAEAALPARPRRKLHRFAARRSPLPFVAAAAALLLVALGLAVVLRPRPAAPVREEIVRGDPPTQAPPAPDPSLEEERRQARIARDLAELDRRMREVREAPRRPEPDRQEDERRRVEVELARLEEERRRLESEKSAAPRPPPDSSPAPAPVPAPEKPTVASPAVALFREVTGTFTLDGRRSTLQKKELSVVAGSRIRAETATRLVLAENRFLLLAPRATAVLNPETARLAVTLEEGDLLAELLGPGPALRVSTKACEAEPLGTVFLVSAQGDRATVLVEEGRVDCRNPRGGIVLGPGQQVTVAAGREVGPASDADLRRLAWARSHRPLERALFREDFDAAGDWKGEVAGGAARAVAAAGASAAVLHLVSSKPVFAIPLRGRLEIVYRAPQGGDLLVQLHAAEPAQNFNQPVRLAPAADWKTLALDFGSFVPADPNDRSSRLRPGRGIDHLQFLFTPGPKGGAFSADVIRAMEVRP